MVPGFQTWIVLKFSPQSVLREYFYHKALHCRQEDSKASSTMDLHGTSAWVLLETLLWGWLIEGKPTNHIDLIQCYLGS